MILSPSIIISIINAVMALNGYKLAYNDICPYITLVIGVSSLHLKLWPQQCQLQIYHLVMTNIVMENPNHKWRFSSLGKSSISMGHGFHGYVTITRGYKFMSETRWRIIRLSKWCRTIIQGGLMEV